MKDEARDGLGDARLFSSFMLPPSSLMSDAFASYLDW